MKKMLKGMCFALIAVALVFGFTSCGGGSTGGGLEKPSDLDINSDTFTLSWGSVSGATSYKVDLGDEVIETTKTSYSLKKLTEDPKKVTLKVMACGSGSSTSAWSNGLDCETALYIFTFSDNGVTPNIQLARAVEESGPANGAGPTITGLTTYGKTLDTIVIPEKVGTITITTIGNGAFANNDKLADIRIAATITEIADGAFKNCTVLVVVVFLSQEPPTMGDDVFNGSDAIENIYVPEGSDEDYADVLPDDVTDKIIDEDPPEIVIPNPPVGNSTITITGLNNWNGADVYMSVLSKDDLDAWESGDEDYEELYVYGYGEVQNGSVTITLMAGDGDEVWVDDEKGGYLDREETEWAPQTGKNYWLSFSLWKEPATGGDSIYGTDEVDYLYTNGQNFDNKVTNFDPETFDLIAFFKTVPYFDFSQSSVALSKFWQAPEDMLSRKGGSGGGYEEIELDVNTLTKVLSVITKNSDFSIGNDVTTWGGVASAAGYSNTQGDDGVEALKGAIIGYYQQEYESQGAYAYGVEIFTYGTDGKRAEVNANTTLLVNQKANIFVGIDYSYDGGGSYDPGGDDDKDPDGKG